MSVCLSSVCISVHLYSCSVFIGLFCFLSHLVNRHLFVCFGQSFILSFFLLSSVVCLAFFCLLFSRSVGRSVRQKNWYLSVFSSVCQSISLGTGLFLCLPVCLDLCCLSLCRSVGRSVVLGLCPSLFGYICLSVLRAQGACECLRGDALHCLRPYRPGAPASFA